MELNIWSEDMSIAPPVLVDKDLIPNKWLYTQENIGYMINGEIFFLQEDNSDEYFSFEIVSDSESINDDKDSNAVLPISIQKTRYGLVINSSILLTTDHWNTIIRQDDYAWCCVCFNIIEETNSHIENEEHIQNMNKYLPLKRFDLNIVRLINDRFHCGVCNESFEITSENKHFDSKDHEIKQLSAINRISDVSHDVDKDSIDTNICDDIMSVTCDTGYYMDLNDNDVYYDASLECQQPVRGVSYASVAASGPKPLIIDWFGATHNVKSDSWNMIIVMKSEYYCMVCKNNGELAQKSDHCKDKAHIDRLQQCRPFAKLTDYVIRKVDDKFYHCASCNNLQLTHLIFDHIHRVHNLKIESAHETDEVPNKIIPSIQNDAKCDEVRDIPDKIDRGNTGSSDDVNIGSAANTETTSNESRKNVTKNLTLSLNDNSASGNLTLPSSDNSVRGNITLPSNDKSVRGNKTLPTNENSGSGNRVNNTFGLQEFIIIHQFGFNLRVHLLAYNLIWQHYDQYYCGVCNVLLEEKYVVPHLERTEHLQMLSKICFIPVLGINLIRAVCLKHYHTTNSAMLVGVHCTICNRPMINDKWIINAHILDNVHLTLLNIALGLNQPRPLPQISQCKQNSQIVPNPVTKNVDKDTQVGLHPEELDKYTKSVLCREKVVSQTEVGHEEKVDNQAKVGQEKKVDNQAKVGQEKKVDNQAKVGQEKKVDNQAKVGQEEKVDNQAKVLLHQAKVDKDSEVGFHQEKADNQRDLNQDKVRNQTKGSTEDNNENLHDLEEFIFVKLKNNSIKITLGSYNALVHIGNGDRYCFLCSLIVLAQNEHLESECHVQNMCECKFIDKFDKNLIRQNSEMYHCSICNVMISKKDIQKHLSWSVHMKSDSLKNAKRHPDSSHTKTLKVTPAKEPHVNHKDDVKLPRVLANYSFDSGNTVESVAKRKKVIIQNGNTLILTWDAWQGVCKNKNGYHCILCKCDLKNFELNSHVCLGKHLCSLERFEIKYLPALIRKVNDTTLNCVTCNSEVINKEHIILDHIKGKKHLKHHEDIRQSSSNTNTDMGCKADVFTIE